MPLHPLKSEWDADLRGGHPLAFPGYGPISEASGIAGEIARTFAVMAEDAILSISSPEGCRASTTPPRSGRNE